MEGDGLLVAAGTLSCIACLLPILTYVLFEDLRNLRFVELVYYISVNDLVATIGGTLPRSRDGSFTCYLQGLTTNYNYISSALWTTTVAYQLWLVTHHGVLLDDSHMRKLHLICWGIPLLATLLPLSTSTYGNADDTIAEWCIIRNSPNGEDWFGKFWSIMGFYIWIWISVIGMVYYLYSVYVRFRQMGESLAPVVRSSLHKLSLYPAIVFVCWVLPSVADMASAFSSPSVAHSPVMERVLYLSYLTPLLQGVLLSLVFALRNPIVRDRWRVAIAKSALACAPRCCPSLLKPSPDGADGVNGAARSKREGPFGWSWGVEKIRVWLSRGDEIATVHIRAENESDYSSRASIASSGPRSSARSSSVWGRIRRSVLGEGAGDPGSPSLVVGGGGGGGGGGRDGVSRAVSTDSVGIDVIPPSSWPPSALRQLQPPPVLSALQQPHSPAAASPMMFGSYFASGSLMGAGQESPTLSSTPSTVTSSLTRGSGNTINGALGESQSSSSSRGSIETLSISEASAASGGIGSVRSGSGRLHTSGSPGSGSNFSHFSNSPSSRISGGYLAGGVGVGGGAGAGAGDVAPGGQISYPENPILQRVSSGKRA